ncbi:hypothetical protein FOA52_015609 [Chlamydomonas sp. UWO 241]|nr:hypothetical protein FOA52_015609 [Chlamydomonas sp. UWO 241]
MLVGASRDQSSSKLAVHQHQASLGGGVRPVLGGRLQVGPAAVPASAAPALGTSSSSYTGLHKRPGWVPGSGTASADAGSAAAAAAAAALGALLPREILGALQLLSCEVGAYALARQEVEAWEDSASGGAWSDEAAREARRSASERHERRLSRIVVDHWRAYAGQALRALRADRHYRRQLCLSALLGLRLTTVRAQADWRRAGVFDARARFLQLGRALCEWAVVAARLRRGRRVQALLSKGRARRVTRAVVGAWRERVAEGAQSRRRKLKAWYFCSFITLTKALRDWRVGVAIKVESRARRDVADAHARLARLASGLAAWHAGVRACRAGRMALLSAHVHAAAALSARAFSAWRARTLMAGPARRAACLALAALREQLEREGARWVLRAWRSVAADARQRRGVAAAAARHMGCARAARVLSFWRWHAARASYLRRCGAAMARTGRRWLMRAALAAWARGACAQAAEARQGARAAVVGRAVLCTLAAYARHSRTKAALVAGGRAAHARATQVHALAAWRAHYTRARTKARVAALVDGWRREQLTRRAVCAWHAVFSHARAKVARAAAADAHCRALSAKKAMASWAVFVSWRRVKRYVDELARRRLLSACARTWAAHARRKARGELQRRVAVRHSYLSTLSTGLRGLQSAVARGRAKRDLHDSLAQRAGARAARAVLTAWADVALPQQRKRAREHAAAAAGARRRRLLVASLLSWQLGAALWCGKARATRMATAHAARARQGAVLRAWAGQAAAAAAARADEDAAVAAARTRLGSAKTARCLAAWIELHAARVTEALQLAAAGAAAGARRARAALTVWRGWLHARRAARVLACRAALLARQRVLRAAWATWRVQVGSRHAARALALLAVGLWARAQQAKGLAGLRWYRQYRVAKGAAMAGARAAHTRQLQRAGAHQWLSVGLWRRQQRLAQLAHHAAAALTADMARTEPYARHWRRVTLARRRARVDLALAAPPAPRAHVVQPWSQGAAWAPQPQPQLQFVGGSAAGWQPSSLGYGPAWPPGPAASPRAASPSLQQQQQRPQAAVVAPAPHSSSPALHGTPPRGPTAASPPLALVNALRTGSGGGSGQQTQVQAQQPAEPAERTPLPAVGSPALSVVGGITCTPGSRRPQRPAPRRPDFV